jgi:hypothetical protein
MASTLEVIPHVTTASTCVSMPHTPLAAFLPDVPCHYFDLEGRRAVGVALDLLAPRFVCVVRWDLAFGVRTAAGEGDSAGTGGCSARFCGAVSGGVWAASCGRGSHTAMSVSAEGDVSRRCRSCRYLRRRSVSNAVRVSTPRSPCKISSTDHPTMSVS